MKTILAAGLLSFTALTSGRAFAEPETSNWQGYRRLDFVVDGRDCLLVLPTSPAEGKPWIWRTEFFGHEPQADVALLAKGFHLAYMDVKNMYGAPVALDHMDNFYDHLRQQHDLTGAQQIQTWGNRRWPDTCYWGFCLLVL